MAWVKSPLPFETHRSPDASTVIAFLPSHLVERSDTSGRSIANRWLRTCSFGEPATRYPVRKAQLGLVHKRSHSRVSIDRSLLGLALTQDDEHVAIADVGAERR